jgi:hypothetical protein
MATMTVRSTYALDIESVKKLERLAKHWGVSKSEALRRSIQAAAVNQTDTADPLQAFEVLQRSLNLSKRKARQWEDSVRANRRASSARRLRRS